MERHVIARYTDVLINAGHTFDECFRNIDACINLLQYLRSAIHLTKSVPEPKQTLLFLVFCINSVNMAVKLTTEKKNPLYEACNDLIIYKIQSFRRVAEVTRMIASGLSGLKYGGSLCRNLEREKTFAIKSHKGSFDANMTLSERACSALQWWCTNIPSCYNEITKCTPSLTNKTDACETGWGAVCKGMRTGG